MKKHIAQGLIGLMVLLSGAVSFAEETTEDDARMAARGWSLLNGSTFGALGSVKDVLVEKDDQGKVLWYVVVMDGGAAVVAPDTEIEPVLAVMPGSDGVIPKGSALDAMLRRDLGNRLAPLRRPPVKLASAATPAALPTPVRSKSSDKWSKLHRISTMKFMSKGGNPATIVRWLDGWNSPNTQGDVQTLRFWNQDSSPAYFKNGVIFNKYTPHNYYCGCVATAGAAIMHYFRAPSGNVITKTCSEGPSMYATSPIELTTKGGTYDWSLIDGVNLTYGLPGTLSDAAVDLLGRVAYDCGVGCEMAYSAEGSGSNTCKLQDSFRKVFNATHAQLVTKDGGPYGGGKKADIGPENYGKIIYNQIRGGAPIALGIDGHEVVACGYGFDVDETDYTYIFLGWGGSNDAWYALPTIDTKATAEGGWYTSTFIDELITEISFDDKFVAVCGQLIDIDGNPIAGGEVKMGNGEVLTTDANGYWGTRVSPDDPNWVADAIGTRYYYEIGAQAKKTTDGGAVAAELAAALPEPMLVQLLDPTIDVYDGDSLVKQHGSIDSAVETARGCANPRIVLTDRAVLQASCTIDFPVVIGAAGEDPLAFAVMCRPGAAMTVAEGVRVLFSNVVFQASAPVLSVAANGTAAFAGKIGIGEIVTSDAGGVELAGALEPVGDNGLLVRCSGSADFGQAFGKWTCGWDEAVAGAPQFANAVNLRASGLAKDDGTLVWQDLVSPGNAVAYREDGGERVNYAYLEDAFAHCPDGGEIVVSKNCKLPGDVPVRLTVSNEVHITSDREGGATVTLVGLGDRTTSGVYVTVTGSLTVEGVQFDGQELSYNNGNCSVFLIEESGELILGSGAGISHVSVVDAEYDGVISVRGGRLEMRDGSFVSDCYDNVDNIKSVALNGGTFNFLGGSVVNGNLGVYACSNAVVNISGTATVTGNFDTDGQAFNVGVGEDATLVLTDELTGTVGVHVQDGENALSNQFGIVSADFAGDPAASAAQFVNDWDRSLVGYATEDMELVWVEAPPAPVEAVARVTYLSSGETQDFASADEAFAAVRGDVTVELLRDLTFANAVTFETDVTLFSADGVTLSVDPTFSRIDYYGGTYFTVKNASFVISNVTVNVEKDDFLELAVENPVPYLGPVIAVSSGELTLDNAVISNFYGRWAQNSAAISAVRSKVALRNGARISDSWNMYYLGTDPDPGDSNGWCGGILAFRSTVVLEDCEINSCYGTVAGGVCLMDENSKVEVSGNVRLTDNYGDPEESDFLAYNLLIADVDDVCLTGKLTGDVYLSEMPAEDEPGDVGRQFGKVDEAYRSVATAQELIDSAARFLHETDDDTGCVVTNATEALLVWSSAIADDVYTNAVGETFGILGSSPPPPPPEPPEWTVVTNQPTPIAFKSIDRVSDTEWVLVITNRVEFCNYRLIWTDDLTKGFTSTGDWEHAVGPAAEPVWTTNVITTGGAWFWRAEGTEGTNMVPPAVEQ